ncbi:MAG: damage-inducible protein DinB [Comamonadaceae bacterium]|nr:MAG: damage-inducible protein DinB [Comamonadaceae bacterium]
MTLLGYFRQLGAYHVWATQRLLETGLAGWSDEAWHRDCGLFFGSVHRTVNHLVVTDDLWHARFAEGRSPSVALDAQPHADREALCRALREAVQRWPAWLATLDAGRLDGELVYVRGNGQAVRVGFAPGLGHVFNHATHHRGQLSAAITAAGREGPELDWIRLQQQTSPQP